MAVALKGLNANKFSFCGAKLCSFHRIFDCQNWKRARVFMKLGAHYIWVHFVLFNEVIKTGFALCRLESLKYWQMTQRCVSVFISARFFNLGHQII